MPESSPLRPGSRQAINAFLDVSDSVLREHDLRNNSLHRLDPVLLNRILPGGDADASFQLFDADLPHIAENGWPHGVDPRGKLLSSASQETDWRHRLAHPTFLALAVVVKTLGVPVYVKTVQRPPETSQSFNA